MNDKQKRKLMEENWIVNKRGVEFIKFGGLLWLAKQENLKEVRTEPILMDHENHFYIYRAIVSGDSGQYQATGDASRANTGKLIWGALIRMAETRAVVRALRLYTGTGLTALEELPANDIKELDVREVPKLTDGNPKRPQRKEKKHENWSKIEKEFRPAEYERLKEFCRINCRIQPWTEFFDSRNWKTPWRKWSKEDTDRFIDQIQDRVLTINVPGNGNKPSNVFFDRITRC